MKPIGHILPKRGKDQIKLQVCYWKVVMKPIGHILPKWGKDQIKLQVC